MINEDTHSMNKSRSNHESVDILGPFWTIGPDFGPSDKILDQEKSPDPNQLAHKNSDQLGHICLWTKWCVGL